MIPLRLAPLSIALLAIMLSACVNITYTPIATDSPRPGDGGPPCAGELKVGEKCLALVRANQKFSSTQLNVEPRETYRISVEPDQVWFDARRRNQPLRPDKGSALMNLFASAKRVPTAGWFSLIGSVVTREGVELKPAHDFTCGADFTVPGPGSLVLYPNDMPDFYGNNGGQVWVTITRIDPPPPEPVSPSARCATTTHQPRTCCDTRKKS